MNGNTSRCDPMNGYYDDGVSIAAQCQSPCDTCTSLTDCITCTTGFVIGNGSCNACDTGYITSNSTCVPVCGDALVSPP